MKNPQKITFNNKESLCFTESIGGTTWTSISGWTFKTENTGVKRLKTKKHAAGGDGAITAPMPGQILKILVKSGEQVEPGDPLFIVEAMKMEHTLKAPCSGEVTDLNFKAGDTVTGNDIILKVINKED